MKNAPANRRLVCEFLRRALAGIQRSTRYWMLGALTLGGCAEITGAQRVSFRPELLETKGDYASPGHVYTMRGLTGAFSRGMDTITVRSEREIGIRTTTLSDPDWDALSHYLIAQYKAEQLPRPLILIGHSLGADDQIHVAEMLHRQGISVDLLILVDPDAPVPIPANVKRCVDIYKSHPATDILPVFRGTKARAVDPSKTDLVNINVRTAGLGFSVDDVNHITIDKKPEVQEMVLAEIKKTCFP